MNPVLDLPSALRLLELYVKYAGSGTQAALALFRAHLVSAHLARERAAAAETTARADCATAQLDRFDDSDRERQLHAHRIARKPAGRRTDRVAPAATLRQA
jgi:hypothetical protein